MIMKIKNITIVGGGSAGWMTATTLLNQFPDKKITLVESPNVPNIGVGESTVSGDQSGFSGIVDWLRLVGITGFDWMSHCDGIHKLSIGYENWYRKDSGIFHFPFGPEYLQHNNYEFQLNDWHLKKIYYPETPVSDYAECFYPGTALINQNKAIHYNAPIWQKGDNEVQQRSGWSFQFDATKFGFYLRDYYCQSDNFTHIQAEVEETPLDDNGLKHLVLDNGQKLEADLFIDCTGFKSLLLTKTFGVPFISIDDYLPNNLAWATKIPYKDPETQIVNYTNCTAIENGWIWEIPLFSRMGAGYVFSDKFVSTEGALKEFQQGLTKKGYENVKDLEYHLIPMRCGIQSKLWVKNTCAIGLAAGFVEPLQSNGLHCIHQFIFNLCRILERGYISGWDRKEFTTKCHDDFYGFAATVATNYVLSHRDDSKYWKAIQDKEWPSELFSPNCDDLSGKFHQAYREKNFNNQFNSYSPVHILATGMNWNPTDIHAIKYGGGNMEIIKKITETKEQQINERKRNWNKQVKDFPSPYQYLKNNIHNEL